MKYQVEARSRQESLLRFLNVRKDELVLDVGCGTGYFTGLVNEQGCRQAVGLDVDLESLRIAKKLNHNQDFVRADCVRLPIRNRVANKVLCTEVLEHVPNDDALATEFSRVLISGGTLVCSSPNESFVFRSKKSSHTAHGPELHVRGGYSQESIIRLLSGAGFTAIEIAYALPLLGALFVEVLERAYVKLYDPLESQSQLAQLETKKIFKLYRLVFPILLILVTLPLPRTYGGSILVARAAKT